jgi:putative mRNA 3-end processing factor
LIQVDDRGLYCPAGDFYIDPWRPVHRAVITHAHADHARAGSEHYISSSSSAPFLRHRLGDEISLESREFGESFELGDVRVSLHPAGHVLGSSQVRVDDGSQVSLVTGDFKRATDPTCESFEPLVCDTLVTEATFALPVYAWRPISEVISEIANWWLEESRRPSILFCYAFGKTQRVLAELSAYTERRVLLHGAGVELTRLYRESGVAMVPTEAVAEYPRGKSFAGELIIAPPSAHRSAWMKRFSNPQTAFASGWMNLRGARRRRGYERGFVLSDHADWKGLTQTIRQSGARRVYATHGQNEVLARYARDVLGLEAEPLSTLYVDSEELEEPAT